MGDAILVQQVGSGSSGPTIVKSGYSASSSGQSISVGDGDIVVGSATTLSVGNGSAYCYGFIISSDGSLNTILPGGYVNSYASGRLSYGYDPSVYITATYVNGILTFRSIYDAILVAYFTITL